MLGSVAKSILRRKKVPYSAEEIMLNREELERRIDQFLQQEVGQILTAVPYANHLADESQELDEDYYLRHRVETIKRIRMTSKTDALALAHMVEEDYDAARLWGRYTVQELNHDLLFLKDLRQHGYTDQLVDETEPFESTVAMLDYLANKIKETGSLAAVSYSIFVEWNSQRCSAKVVERAEEKYSRHHVVGSKTHVGIDDDQDHYKMMLDISYRLLLKKADESILFNLLKSISALFASYFRELYEKTVLQRELKSPVAN
jgi:hypothetical protein